MPDTPNRAAPATTEGAEPTSSPASAGLLGASAKVLLRGAVLGRAGVTLSAQLARVALGRSSVQPERSDWRFKDPAWTGNVAYRRLAQSYLALCQTVEEVVDEMEEGADKERARFVAGVVTSAVAPTNFLPGNPAALKRAFNTGGASLVSGARHLVHDLLHNGGMPSMAEPGALRVGHQLALTPGRVVDRDDVAEVLQYQPITEEVFERPTLVVPPPIGRYYFLDLQPGRSFVEYAVAQGLQTFLVSWRNPSPEQAEWNLDTYAQRVLDAIDTVREVSGSDDVNLIGFCAGGIIQTAVLNHLAALGDTRVHAAAFAVTLLDFGRSAPIDAFSSAGLLSLGRFNSRRRGVISARAMGTVFSLMRPNDLVWNYWVNNYLLGQDPPVFDILSWNADGTNLPAGLHRQFLDIFQHNLLVEPGAMMVLGTPVDVTTITIPTYVTGAVNDHLTPWQGCFSTTQLLAGDSTYALSNAGHIASLVNPPGNPKASYYTGPLTGAQKPHEWLEGATKVAGSWWEHWAEWARVRSGNEVDAPDRLGSEQHPPLEVAPGVYVRRKN